MSATVARTEALCLGQPSALDGQSVWDECGSEGLCEQMS